MASTQKTSTSLPDLVVDKISSPESAAPGEKILINTTVRNAGDGDAGTFRLSVYLSQDGTVSDDDLELGYGDVPDLAAGKSRQGSAVAVIPQNTTAGSYYIVALADSLKVVNESDKTNNFRTMESPITISAKVANQTPTPIPTIASTPVATRTLAPAPTATLAPVPTKAVSTPTPIVTIAPTQEPTVSPTPAPTVKQTPVPTAKITIAPTTAVPTPKTTSKASDETNQVTSNLSTQLLPDLVVKVRSSGTSGTPGGSFKVTTTLQNNGKADASNFDVSLYLSPDQTFDPKTSYLVGQRKNRQYYFWKTDGK